MRTGGSGVKQAALLWLLAAVISAAAAAGQPDWRPAAIVRCENINAVDDGDGPLASFLRRVRNDGLFVPPVATLAGPPLHNPTLFGFPLEPWIEAVLLVPVQPGGLETVWTFTVDDRDEYLNHLGHNNLTSYEGMDGVTVLHGYDADGMETVWYLEWLPGNVAVFGGDRSAVGAVWRVYSENGASRGLLASAGGEYIRPDILFRMDPGVLAAWQPSDHGRYWWRNLTEQLSRDLASFWQPAPSRFRLVERLTEQAALWPQRWRRLDLSIWFEESGIEWRFRAESEEEMEAVRSQLDLFRHIPGGAVAAYALPVTAERFAASATAFGALVNDAAGGVVPSEVRALAAGILDALAAAGCTQAAAALVPPPPGRPELGASSVLLSRWDDPEAVRGVLTTLRTFDDPGTAGYQLLAQLGWRLAVETLESEGFRLRLYPLDQEFAAPLYDALAIVSISGSTVALVIGPTREESVDGAEQLDHRADLASQALGEDDAGSAPVRETFVRIDRRGASGAGFVDALGLAQLALIEAADWRPRSPDQPLPESARLAREMLEYNSGGPWSFVEEAEPSVLVVNGGASWRSLLHVAGALGITEAIGLE